MLISLGEATLDSGEYAKRMFVSSFMDGADGALTEDHGTRMYEAVLATTQEHLQ